MMNIKEKIQKIEEFIDTYIGYDRVLKGINDALTDEVTYYDASAKKSKIIVERTDEFLVRVSMSEYTDSKPYSQFTNNYSKPTKFQSIFVPSIDLRDSTELNARIILDNGSINKQFDDYKRITFPDILITIPSEEELEEIIFNLVLQYGDCVEVTRMLLVYALYRKYMNIVPKRRELLFSFSGEETTFFYEFMESL